MHCEVFFYPCRRANILKLLKLAICVRIFSAFSGCALSVVLSALSLSS